MASSDRFVAVGEEEMERLLSDKDSKNTKRKISDAKIFDIIYQLSPLLECDPTVCLPSKS